MDRRDKILIKTSWVATVGNTILSVAKIVVGLAAGSLAVLGDGIDSAIDVVISVAMIYTSRIIARPPSKKYPYGFDKAEGIATKVVAFIIFAAGLQMLIASVQGIFSSEPKELPGRITIYVTVFSIIGKIFLSYYQYRQGRKISSELLIANAKNMRNDVIISLGVLLGLFFTFMLDMSVLDTVTGLLVSLFIMRSAIGIFVESSVGLMDGVKDMGVYDEIFAAVDSVPGVLNPHRVRSRQIGSHYIIALDIEVDGDMTLNQAHDISNAVEASIRERVENVYDIIVHVEPIGKAHPDEKFGLDKTMLD